MRNVGGTDTQCPTYHARCNNVPLHYQLRHNLNWIFDLEESICLCVTTEILNEYAEIIGKRSGPAVVENLMNVLLAADNVHHVTKYFSWNLIQTDPDDNKFVDCAIACGADMILTEDKHFQILADIPFPKVVTVTKLAFQKVMLH